MERLVRLPCTHYIDYTDAQRLLAENNLKCPINLCNKVFIVSDLTSVSDLRNRIKPIVAPRENSRLVSKIYKHQANVEIAGSIFSILLVTLFIAYYLVYIRGTNDK